MTKVKKLTKQQKIILTGFTGILCCKFSDYHEDVERRLGRPVFNIELGSQDFKSKMKKLYEKEFLELVS